MPKIMISDELKNHFLAKIYKYFYFLMNQNAPQIFFTIK
jgi:hypothetical protein